MARKTLADRIQDIERKKAVLQNRQAILSAQMRKAHNLALFKAGRLIDKAGLLDQPENVLLGALMELADLAKDAGKIEAWGRRGRNILTSEPA